MSIWHKAKDENIDLDFEENQVDIMVFEDYNGANYVTLTFEQIEMLKLMIDEGAGK